MTMRVTVDLNDECERVIRSVMRDQNVDTSKALRFIVVRYGAIVEDLTRRGVTIREQPAKIELEFPK